MSFLEKNLGKLKRNAFLPRVLTIYVFTDNQVLQHMDDKRYHRDFVD